MLTTYTRLLAEKKVYSSIPRDITCWYCQRGRHTDCFSKKLCACWYCLNIHDHKETK